MIGLKKYVEKYLEGRFSENRYLGSLTLKEIRSRNASTKYGDKCMVTGIPDVQAKTDAGNPLFDEYGNPVMVPGKAKIDGVEVQNGDILVRCDGWIKL